MMTRKMPPSCRFSPACTNQADAQRSDQKNCVYSPTTKSIENMTVKFKGSKKYSGKSTYRHIPHCQKPAHLVAKRNARERRRVEAVNNAFHRLRKHVNFETKQKRLSKVKTLRVAIDYIRRLQRMISEHDRKLEEERAGSTKNVQNAFSRKEFPGRAIFGNSNNQISLTNSFCRKQSMWRNTEKMNTRISSAHNRIWVSSAQSEENFSSLPEYGSLGMNEITVLPDM